MLISIGWINSRVGGGVGALVGTKVGAMVGGGLDICGLSEGATEMTGDLDRYGIRLLVDMGVGARLKDGATEAI
jgi:hypothetical protein